MYDNNLPPQLAEDSYFNNETKPLTRSCLCKGKLKDCTICDGWGEIELSFDEVAELEEYNRTKNLDL